MKINATQYVKLLTETPRAGQMLNHISFSTANAEQMRACLTARAVKSPPRA